MCRISNGGSFSWLSSAVTKDRCNVPSYYWTMQNARSDLFAATLHLFSCESGCQVNESSSWYVAASLFSSACQSGLSLLVPRCVYQKEEERTPLCFLWRAFACSNQTLYCILSLAAYSTWQRLLSWKWNPEIPRFWTFTDIWIGCIHYRDRWAFVRHRICSVKSLQPSAS